MPFSPFLRSMMPFSPMLPHFDVAFIRRLLRNIIIDVRAIITLAAAIDAINILTLTFLRRHYYHFTPSLLFLSYAIGFFFFHWFHISFSFAISSLRRLRFHFHYFIFFVPLFWCHFLLRHYLFHFVILSLLLRHHCHHYAIDWYAYHFIAIAYFFIANTFTPFATISSPSLSLISGYAIYISRFHAYWLSLSLLSSCHHFITFIEPLFHFIVFRHAINIYAIITSFSFIVIIINRSLVIIIH